MSNIEDDVKRLNSLIKVNKDFFENQGDMLIGIEDIKAIEHILTEREQDKKKIQELEAIDEANRKVIVEKCDYIQNDSIPKQKVKDKIEKLRNDIKLGNCRYPYVEEHKIDILQELLEGEK